MPKPELRGRALSENASITVFGFSIVKNSEGIVDILTLNDKELDLNEAYRCICDMKNQLETFRIVDTLHVDKV